MVDRKRSVITGHILGIHKALNGISRTLRDFETDVNSTADNSQKLRTEVQVMISQANECLQRLNEIKGIIG